METLSIQMAERLIRGPSAALLPLILPIKSKPWSARKICRSLPPWADESARLSLPLCPRICFCLSRWWCIAG